MTAPGSYPADAAFRARCERHLRDFDRIALEPDGRRRSAVALCIVAGPTGEACLLVTQRAAGLRAHPGQFSLPGGRLEPDEDAVAAARRELREEVGLSCAAGDVLGVLDDYATRSGFLITPAVVWGPPASGIAPDPAEVAAVHLVPVSDLDLGPRLESVRESDRPVIRMPVAGHWIHAPTAALLYQFREVAVHGRPTRVRDFEPPRWAWGP